MESAGWESQHGVRTCVNNSHCTETRSANEDTVNDSDVRNDAKGNTDSRTEIIPIDDEKTVDDSGPLSQTPRKPQHHYLQCENEYEYIDVVWLKKDVRWTDHGPLSEVAGVGGGAAFQPRDQQRRKFVILYLYEPDQLREHSVHGSHLRFVHEGLVDMDGKLNEPTATASEAQSKPTETLHGTTISRDDTKTSPNPSFQYLTVCHNTIISTLNAIHFRYPASSSLPPSASAYAEGVVKPAKRKYYKIASLLAHEETGHWQSYMRDRSVRKWCKTRSIPFLEFNQNGVTRRLKLRDDYLKLWKAYMAKPLYSKIDLESPTGRASFKSRLIQLDELPEFVTCPRGIANLFDINDKTANERDSGRRILGELPPIHRSDRKGRQQFGGETKATNTLNSFLSDRGARYSEHISSPNSSWNSCSRLSVYLTWGHISLRRVLKALEDRRIQLRKLKTKSPWLKSLQAFGSRAHWRSHFVQKLETEPTLEKCDLCPAYQHLRRQDGDWDPQKYVAWETGTTGYPFVDACMRCLIEHGWLNFRMRAMLVSFATYNLWLDWKRIAPHLARVFLDYEPGIHYPQLQMQAGTTGINAMRVYNATKQGKDQDPKGVFIRRYVPELRNVPDQYIHEPWKMSEALKDKYYKNKLSLFAKGEATLEDDDCRPYPEPIVDEKESARVAKAKLNEVKKAVATRIQANQVYIKHGSRSRQSNEMNHRASGGGALPAVVAIEAGVKGRGRDDPGRQPKIKDAFDAAAKATKSNGIVDLTSHGKKSSAQELLQSDSNHCVSRVDLTATNAIQNTSKRFKFAHTSESKSFVGANKRKSNPMITSSLNTNGNNTVSNAKKTSEASWSCTACTFLNDKPYGLVCGVCGTPR